MAVGLVMTGSAIGGIIAPLITQLLISASDWRKAYIILGIIILVISVPLALLLKQNPRQVGLKPYGGEETVEDKRPQELRDIMKIDYKERSRNQNRAMRAFQRKMDNEFSWNDYCREYHDLYQKYRD